MNVRELLLCAADHIERVGLYRGWFWPQGRQPVKDRPCCALGALRVCADPEAMDGGLPQSIMNSPVVMAAVEVLKAHLNIDSVSDWNDKRVADAAEVAAAMRAAADKVTP